MQSEICDYVERHRNRLFELIGELVRRPSENTPPHGAEAACQKYIASVLCGAGWDPELYEPDSVAGLHNHPWFAAGRNYTDRPNLGARRRGFGGGRSLILSGHIDTVPRGTQPWTRDAFGAVIEGNLLYGRGSNDMKAGVAINLFAAECVARMGLQLGGDLIFETVVDEEFGGANGTLAGRLRGYLADAAIIAEPSSLRICPAQRGGRTVHITFSAPGGILSEAEFPAGAIDELTHFLIEVRKFAAQRRSQARPHPLYTGHADPVPVTVTKIVTAPWGNQEPITPPEECKVELYWQTMPGETQEGVEREFHQWFDGMLAAAPGLFGRKPELQFPVRWLPGSAIAADEPLVTTLADTAEAVLGRRPPVAGIEGPCDMFLFHQFQIPAVLWGPAGGNTHAADEYVELDSTLSAAKALVYFIARWCAATN